MIPKPGETLKRKLLLLLLVVSGVSLAEPLRVFASVIPSQSFVEKIGGKQVDARAMVRPGFNPHTYDPTPQQISALTGVVLYVRTGMPFENAWMERIRSANRCMQVLDVREGIVLRALEAHVHDEHGAEHIAEDHHGDSAGIDVHHQDRDAHTAEHANADELDPHVWTSPPLVRHMSL